MVTRIKHRFIILVLAVLALSAVLSVAGSVVDAAIGRGQARALIPQILGGESADWQPARLPSASELEDRQRQLRDLATDGRYIHTPTHIFDPLRDPVLPTMGAFQATPAFPSKLGGNYYLVQMEGRFHDADFEERLRRTGAQVVGTMPGNSYVLRANPLQIERVSTFSETRWSGPFHPFYRLQPYLLGLLEGEREADYLDPVGRVGLAVDLFHGERADDYVADVLSLPGVSEVEALVLKGELSENITLMADYRSLPEVLAGLSRLGGVRTVAGAPNVSLFNDQNRWVHQTYNNEANLDIAAKVHTAGVTGVNQIIAIVDTGLENDNCQFRYGPDVSDVTYYQYRDPTEYDALPDPIANVTNPCNKVITYYLSNNATKYDPAAAGSPQHGTHVASTIAGDNFRTDSGSNGLAAFCEIDADTGEPVPTSTGNPPNIHAGPVAGQWDGLAPGAQLVIQDRGGAPGTALDLPTSRILEAVQSYESGAKFQNNSFGAANQPTYDTLHSLQLDNRLYYWRDFNVTWAAGNTGDEPPPTLGGYGAVAKNTITVGAAIDGTTGECMDLAFNSSRGPTTDGRLKPDLAACGGNIDAASSNNPLPADQDPGGAPNGDLDCVPQSVESGGGTSFSTPAVTGMAALVAQYFEDGYYPTGKRTRGEWAVPGMRVTLDDGTPLQTDPNVNVFADKCTGQPDLCDPGTSFRPSNALVRAVMLNATRNMTGEETGSQPGLADARPNYGQGWGLPVIDDALFFEGDVGVPGGQRSGLLILSDTPNGVLGDLELTDVREDVFFRFDGAFSAANDTEIKEWDVTVLAGEPLVVTLCWADPGEGSVAGEVLRNDLDLELIGPNPDPNSSHEDICWRPNPELSYTAPASQGFARDGWISTETMIESTEAQLWLGKDGAPIPPDKSLWPDFASADRFNNCEQIALKAEDVYGGTYQLRVVNWDLRGAALQFTAGEPDFEVDGKGTTGIGTDNVELNQQGYALILTGAFATTQGVISFNQPFFNCGPDQMARITLRDQNGCADANPIVQVTTTTPDPAFPSDFEEFALIPDFPCNGSLPPDDEAQPKVWRTEEFRVINTADPANVVQGSGSMELMPGFEMNAQYIDVDPAGGRSTAKASLRCQASFQGDGFVINGGCDLERPTEPEGPTNPVVADQFMDADELIEYTAFFFNSSSADFNDVYATLSQVDDNDGDGRELEVLNNPVYVGRVPSGRRASATFLVQMDGLDPAGSVQPQERITLQVALTSPADDMIDPVTFTDEHKLESDVQVYTYNTRDTRGTLFGQGLIEELRPGRTRDEGPDAFRQFDDMMVDPGPDGVYQTPKGGTPQGDDDWSLNFINLAPFGADDAWDFDDDNDGWTTYSDPVWDAATSGWFRVGNEAGDNNSAGGCGWNDNYETPVGEMGNGIWHTGEDSGVTIGGVHPQTATLGLPLNTGPDPDRPYDDMYVAPNNQAPRVCATYKKAPDNGQPLYLWYAKAPRIYKTTRSTEFTVAWQRWTHYNRIFGHITSENNNFTAFAGVLHNQPLPDPITFREPQYFNGIFASAAGPFPENPVAADWNDDTDNTWTWGLAAPDGNFPDRSYEDVFGPPSTDGWEHMLLWWMQLTDGSPVPNRYGFGFDDSAFIWNESRETDDQTDCALTIQKPTVFFNQFRYNLCEGTMDVTVIDPNQPGLGYVYVWVATELENSPPEILRLNETPESPTRYEGRIPFSSDPRKNIRGVLLTAGGFNDTGQGNNIANVQYDWREAQIPGPPEGTSDWLDDGWALGGCTNDGPDEENDDFRNNCSVADLDELLSVANMTATNDDDGDTCPDGDGVPDAEDDCDSLLNQDLTEWPECQTLQDNCPSGGFEVGDGAWVNCPSGGVFYIKHDLIDIQGDGDRYADRNEELYLSVSIINLLSNDLENALVRITTEDQNLCILEDESYYGDIIGVTSARLLGLERIDQIVSTPPVHPVTGEVNYFRLGVPPETITADLNAIETAQLRVDIYAENYATSGDDFSAVAPLIVELPLDLDPASNGSRPDFFETFCDASGPSCSNPPGKPTQPWYTEPGFWADTESGIEYIDSREMWPDNGGFCPECPYDSPTGCSTTLFDPPATEPPCMYEFDGTGPAGDPDYVDDWHIETLGVDTALFLGSTHTGQNALHFGDHSTLSYNRGQLSALVLPEVPISSDPACTPELRFWHMAQFWNPNFTSGLSTPIGTNQLQISRDRGNSYPETSWLRLDPYEGNYNTYTDALNACRGLMCQFHQPTFQAAGNYLAQGNDVNGAGLTGRWQEAIIDLSDFRGDFVKIRFLQSVIQDINVSQGNNRGWTIDDISITCVANTGGHDLETDPLVGPGPCGLQASFSVFPQSTCLSSPAQFADTHVGLGLSDGMGGREPIEYEWDLDGDTTPEIACGSGCFEGVDVSGHVNPSPNISLVEGNCEAPKVTYSNPSNYNVRMTLCQAGSVQDTYLGAVRVREDLSDSNITVANSPVVQKGDPGCPNNAPEDLNGDTVVDGADDAIWASDYVGCVYQGTRLRQEASISGGTREANYCWANEGAVVCGERNGINFYVYDTQGAFPDFVTVIDAEGGCQHTVPVGVYIIPGPDPMIGNIEVFDQNCGQSQDANIDLGEYIRIVMDIQNTGAGPMVEMVGQLRTPDSQVEIHKAASRIVGPVDPFVINPGETGTAEFEFLVSETHACKGVLVFNLVLFNWDRTASDTMNFTLPVGLSTAQNELCSDADVTGDVSGNQYVCDPGNGDDASGCPSLGPDPTCCPARQGFQTDTACSTGTIENICVNAQITLNGIGNYADQANVTLVGPDGQTFPVLIGNPAGANCQDIVIDLCTTDTDLGDEGTNLCGIPPVRDAQFYADFQEAFQNSDAGATWTLRVEDAQKTSLDFNPGMFFQMQNFSVDVDFRSTPVCQTVPLQDACLTDEYGPIYGGPNRAQGCAEVIVTWLSAMDQEDMDKDRRPDEVPMDYEVFRAESTSCDLADAPAIGAFASIGTTSNSTFFADNTVDPSVDAYWYRAVAMDGAGNDSTDPTIPNPDDPAHWVCTPLASLCPAPIDVGPLAKVGGNAGADLPITSSLAGFDGVRLYRGSFFNAPGGNIDPSSQNHEVIDGVVGNCFEPNSVTSIGDDDGTALSFGKGSFYYLAVSLVSPGVGQPYVEGSIDTAGFPGNSQQAPRVPAGNNDCQ